MPFTPTNQQMASTRPPAVIRSTANREKKLMKCSGTEPDQ
jgi:hypothetical protein